MTARERWEQTLSDAWRAFIDLDDATSKDITLVWQISRFLGHDVCDQIASERRAERDERCPNCCSGHRSWSNFDRPVCEDPWHTGRTAQ